MRRRGLDTNVLVYAHIPEFEHHEKVRAFLLEELRRPGAIFVISPHILHEFVHIVTDGRRFERPVVMREALGVARGYLGKSNVECIGASESILLKAFELMDRYQLGRRRIADTIFAATLIESGIEEVITCNPGDFEIFGDLRAVDPCKLP